MVTKMKDNTEITIKELAEKLGISKQAVRRYFEQLPPSLMPIKKEGSYRIGPEAQAFIESKVSTRNIKLDTNDGSNKKCVDTTLDSASIDNFKSEKIESLSDEFLKDKDEQIIFLQKQIDKLSTLLDQQQQLTLQGNKQIDKLQLLLDSDSEASEQLKEQVDDSKIMLDVQSRMITQLEEIIEEKTERNKLILHELAELRKKNRTSFWRRLFPSKYNNSIRFSDYKIDK